MSTEEKLIDLRNIGYDIQPFIHNPLQPDNRGTEWYIALEDIDQILDLMSLTHFFSDTVGLTTVFPLRVIHHQGIANQTSIVVSTSFPYNLLFPPEPVTV